jgi:endonuclease-3
MTVAQVVATLKRHHGPRPVYGDRSDPFQVLITTILSQRTRNENTRTAAARLFSRFRTPRGLARANRREVEELIRPAGFFKAKARHIQAAAGEIVRRFGSHVPEDLDELLSLPGVGRKTANCVLVYAFHRPAIPVDVHVHRIANRLGWVATKDPEETETALMAIAPKRQWILLNDLLVRHGRTICLPRRPRCAACPVVRYCARAGVVQEAV